MAIISVIVPIYKVEKYLRRCVDSILNQTFTNFELILVDDGSPDNCGKICDEYAAKDSRVVVIHKENGGLSEARNAGIDWTFENSESEWITFIDSDDWVHRDYLKLLLEAAVRLKTGVCICSFKNVNGYVCDENIKSVELSKKDTEEAYVSEQNIMTACAKLFKKDAFRFVRFPSGRLHEDIFTTYKILFSFSTVAVLKNKIYYYYKNPNSIMHTKWTPGRLDEISAHKEQIDFFNNSVYKRAYKKEIRAYMWVICEQIKELQTEHIYPDYKKLLTKNLRKAIRQYKKEIGISLPEYTWLIETAYPIRMSIYWKFKKATQHNKSNNERQ